MRKRDKDSEYTVNVKLKKVLNHRYKKQFLVLAMILSVSVLLSAFAYAQEQPGGFPEGIGFPEQVDSAFSDIANQPPSIRSVEPDKPSPQPMGTAIKWTVRAEDPENDPISYMFQLKDSATWVPLTQWIDENTWTWNTAALEPGNYQIRVLVRDPMHTSGDFKPDERIIDYQITAPQVPAEVSAPAAVPELEQAPVIEQPIVQAPEQIAAPVNQPPQVLSLNADLASPQIAGAAVTFIAAASDPENDPLEFMFLVDGQARTDFINNPSWTWMTTEQDIGSHSIEVRARDNNHNPQGDSSQATQFAIEPVPNNPPQMVDLSADQPSPQIAGAAVTFTAAASDPENDPLEFMFLVDGQARTDFINNPSWTWTTTEQDIGSHTIEARTRDNNHNPQGDSSQAIQFSIEPVPNNPPEVVDLASDLASPQIAGAAVTFTAAASDPENDPLEFMFLVDGQARTDFINNPSWTWTTTEQDIGSHTIEARARDNNHNPEGDSSRTMDFVVEAVPNNPPELVDLVADLASPQIAGTAVTFTAAASDPENDPLEFMFLVDGQARTDFINNPSWTWTTTVENIGPHTIEVRARDNNHNPEGDSSRTMDFVVEAVPNNPPELVDLVADLASPQIAGAAVTFTAAASDPENDPLEFMFLLDGVAQTEFISSPSWTWTTTTESIGSHIIEVRARDNNHNPEGDSSKTAEFVVEAVPNNPPEVVDLASDLASPQIAGAAVTFTAAASDPENDPLEFMFLLDGVAQTEFISSPSWTWTTTTESIGSHIIEVRARDNNHNPEGDSSKTAEFVVEAVPNNPPEVVDLASDLASPQIAGAAVTFTAAASDPENDPLEFMFLLDGVAQTEFISSPSWTWTTTTESIGSHIIEVRARDNNHNPEGDSSKTAEFVVEAVPNNPPEVVDLASDLASPQIAGAAVTFTAAASDPENDTLEFMFLLDDVAQTEFTSIPSWTWTTTEQDIGSHTIEVRARDNNHNPEGDSSQTAEFVVEAVPNNPPEVFDLASDLASPQIAGAAVTFTAAASDPENDPLEFMFLVDGQARTDFINNPSWTWTTTEQDIGSHTIEVRARDNNHNPEGDSSQTAEFVVEAAPNNPPEVFDLASDLASPQIAGTAVTFTAAASDPENDTLEFMFLLDDVAQTEFTSSPSWTWTTTEQEIGSHTIEVRARDNNHNPEGDSSRTAEFVVEAAPNNPPELMDLAADLASPQLLGSRINWTATASDAENDTISYRFLVNDTPVTDWQPENLFPWTATEAGTALITVQVKDDQHDEPAAETGSISTEFVITAPEPAAEEAEEEILPVELNESPSIISLAPDLESPQVLGSSVNWTATASDAENDTISYRFLVNDTPVTDWQSENLFAWTATGAGTALVTVQVKDDQHDGPEGESGNRSSEFAITMPLAEEAVEEVAEAEPVEEAAAEPNESPSITELSADLGSPQVLGSSVNWTAVASDPEDDPISYRFLVNETAVTDWQAENKFIWTASEAGSFLITAQARDDQHEGPEGDSGNRSSEFVIVPLEEEAPFAEEPAEEIAPAETNVTDQVNVTAPANVTDEENATAQANMTAEAENVTEVVEIPEDTLAPPVTENITTPIAPENITENLTEEVSEEDAEVVAPVVENQTPVLNSLIPDIISPQKPGVTVTWTANATDVDMDPLLFRFFLNGPATNGAWEPKTEWISDDTWAWVTSSIDRGENQVKVQVRDGQHSGEDGFDSEYSGYFTLAEPKMNISGLVYEDKNGNGVSDSGEALSGWTVQITKPDQSQVSVLTREDGTYSFQDLDAGSYTISETLPSGWVAAIPEGGSHNVDLSEGDVEGLDFVNKLVQYTISGRKFNDLNGNGAFDGEPGMEGWTIELSRDGSLISTATTEKDGSYKFAELSPGSYTVSEVEQAGWTRTAPPEGSYTVELTDGDVADINFGNHGSFAISGTSFLDSNGNGVKDEGEPGRAGVAIQLSRDGSVINATTTLEDGSYAFRNLSPGTYSISQVAAEGINQIAPEGPWTVELKDADVADKDFANSGGLSISGQKYYDINGNGLQDEDEPGIPGGEVSLVENGKVVANTTTDENGLYSFENVLPGTYTINDPVPTGMVLTTSSTVTVTIKTVVVTNVNFGIRGSNSISGMKYEDLNSDSTKNPGEKGLSGWEMVLTGSTWFGKPLPTLTATTDNNGNYKFERLLPGTYKVSETSRTGWTQTAPAGGSHSIVFDVRTPPREAKDNDFGNRLAAQSISGVKYNDINGNGVRDPGEPGMGGWKINLEPAGGGVIKVATTEADGSYSFTDVASGTYTVREIHQPGWDQKAPASGTYTVTLDSSTTSVSGKDFGNWNPLPANPSLIPDKSSPQRSGTPIIWTARADDLDPLQYRFLVRGPGINLDTGYSSRSVWTWNTLGYPAGKYEVEVWIRDGQHSGPGGYDVKKTVSFSLTGGNLPPSVQVLYTDRPEPQYAGSWIKWTAIASDPDRDPLQYRFFLRGPATRGFWVDMTGWGKSNQWIWRTTPADVGYSEVLVAVRDGKHAGPAGSDDYQVGRFFIMNVNLPPVITGLGTNLPSAQPVGATIRWAATASDPEGNPLFFRYWMRGPSTGGLWRMVRDWSTDPTWTWPTTPADAGTSEIKVQVRDGLHSSPAGWDDDAGALFTVRRQNLPPTLISLGSDKPSSQKAGTPVTWTAIATDPDMEPLLYRFWLKGPSTGNSWKIVQDWSYKNQWTWASLPSDGGAYTVYVYVRDGWHNPETGYDSAVGAPFILAPNQPPVLTALKSDRLSPQGAGTPVKWTAAAIDADKDPIYYRFWLKGPSTGNVWQIAQDWSLANQWTWSSMPNDGGAYTVYVYARDGWHYPDTGYDSALGSSYQLISNQPPVLTALKSDRPSPQGAGTPVKWTATASDADKDPLYYQFWLKGPSTGNVWRIVQSWSAKNQWTWSSAPTDAGNYRVYVYVRDGKHAPANAYDSAMGQGYMLQDMVRR